MAIELDNSFTVPVPPEQAWEVLLDVERIAPCMPGASVLSVDGDSIEGQVKVKLGPLSLTYKGTAKFVEKDQANHTIVLNASGKETRGAGTASATVNAVLAPGEEAGTTTASIHTSLNVTGRPAQFGRSLLPEVSGKLIDQFAANLEALIEADAAPATAPAEGTTTEGAAHERSNTLHVKQHVPRLLRRDGNGERIVKLDGHVVTTLVAIELLLERVYAWVPFPLSAR